MKETVIWKIEKVTNISSKYIEVIYVLCIKSNVSRVHIVFIKKHEKHCNLYLSYLLNHLIFLIILFCFCLFCFVSFVYPNLFDLQSKTPSPKTSINNNNNNNEKPQAPVSLDFLRSVPKSTPTTTGTSGSYQYQMRRRLVN